MQELPPLLDFLKRQGHHVETIVVNDGSAQADLLASCCATHGWRLLHHATNAGKGAAVRTGMLAAGEDIRIFTDADIPFQYSIFKAIEDAFADAGTSVVVGDRRKSDYFAQSPVVRRAGSAVFSLMVDVIMCHRLGDTQCGIKAFRAATVEKIFRQQRINGFAADIEWIYKARKAGYGIRTVSAEFRNAGESSVVFWKHALLMLKDVLRLRFS